MRRVHGGLLSATTGYFRMIYRGGLLTAEADSAGALSLGYLWGLGADDLVGVHDYVGSQRYYAIQDGLRSVRGLSRRDGTWVASLRYRAYGAVSYSAGTIPFKLRYRWIGQELDEETGFYYVRARYYDPGSQRFTQEDPIGYAGGSNVYAYGDGNPTNGRDLDGLDKDYERFAAPPDNGAVSGCMGTLAGCYEADPFSDGLHSLGAQLGVFELWLGRQRIPDAVRVQMQRLYNNSAHFRATANTLLGSGREFHVLDGALLPLGCEGSAVGYNLSTGLDGCRSYGQAYGPSSEADARIRVTGAMEEALGGRVTGGVVLINTSIERLPNYFADWAHAIWHEMTHLLGYVDGHGGMYPGHRDPVFCGVPLSQAVCPR